MAFIGLGNPGEEYADTPHNAGYHCINSLCRRLSLNLKKMGTSMLGTQTEWLKKKVLLAVPSTYMNESGYAVRYAVDHLSIEVENLFIVYDDIDLPMGTIRIREKGSAGAHKGMKSIIQHIGCQDFPRIRIGIQPEGQKITDRVRYVLSPVKKRNRGLFELGVQMAVDAVQSVIEDGLKAAMNRYNRRINSLLLEKRLI